MNDKFNKPYNPKEVEEKIYRLWEESGCFNPDNLLASKTPNQKLKTYSIVMPPPNVTGTLHLGHALNAVIQDILIRKKRMEGYKTLWVPGTDHAGIATQNVVEKWLKKEGLARHRLGKEKFLEKVWEWKERYGSVILNQLKKIGASCDWSRLAFTMDENYSLAVKEAFNHYHEKGLIYRGERVVNWCPRCGTSLSDLELEYEEEKGKLWHIKYPLKENSRFITVATTRPETMLGDSAVAVNPEDARHKDFIGKVAILPIQNRGIPIIADFAVEKEFGTGAVKVTPAHDFTDAEIGERHNLPVYKIIDERGKMTKEAGAICEGLKASECREKVIGKLKEMNLLEKEENYVHAVAKCYRCGGVVEPLPSLQWFLKMDGLAKEAIEAVEKGEISFHPKKWEKIYLDWLRNIKDWCISRQIWWGHKIPLEGIDDVLDTWFSSALWPLAVLGWPNKNSKDLKEFYPTQALSTARDIINLWVARMVFSGIESMGKAPFKDVIIHATILTKDGKRMSKSLGTGVDPMDLIEKYGADATRFSLIWQSMGGQDIRWTEEHVVAGKKFCNKIWNAARFVLLNATAPEDYPSEINFSDLIGEFDKKIVESLEETQKIVEERIENFEFGQALHSLYEFFWHQFCDDYIENSKKQPNNEILGHVLASSLKLLHPFMPFITEEIYQNLFTRRSFNEGGPINPPAGGKNMLMIEKW